MVSKPYEPVTQSEAERLTEELRRRGQAFKAQPEPIRTHLVPAVCRCGSGIYHSPDSSEEPMCSGCRAADCGA